MPHENILDPSRTALAVIDVQESFRPHIPDFAELAARVRARRARRAAARRPRRRHRAVPEGPRPHGRRDSRRPARRLRARREDGLQLLRRAELRRAARSGGRAPGPRLRHRGARLRQPDRARPARARLPGAPPDRLRLLARRAEPPGRARQDAPLRRASLLDRAGALRADARRAPRTVQGDSEIDKVGLVSVDSVDSSAQ